MRKCLGLCALLLILYALVVSLLVVGIAHTEYKLWCADIDTVPGIIAEWGGKECHLVGDQTEVIDWNIEEE